MNKSILCVILVLLSLMSFEQNQKVFPSFFQPDAWIAPPEANKIKNPFASDQKSINSGKIIYTTYCISCHGEEGKGDGAASLSIKNKPADHSGKKMQTQSDGAIFWKLTEGRPALDMISYKFVLSENERWDLVNYIRTLAAK
ncbi:MAG: hypothetical protein A3F72_07825 [Bacteroidetes bacterium RIFCSPLOWO2_12_FULL_35_15]|nr:MAG: hypothetical protein A3F72_07825 [Bacteroidetes bacterium RIFCSPLOWO2_12_FULL_35_15]